MPNLKILGQKIVGTVKGTVRAADDESTLGVIKMTYLVKEVEINASDANFQDSKPQEDNQENSAAQFAQKEIDDAKVRYSGNFSKFTAMRVEEVLAEDGDFVSAVNGFLEGPLCRFGVLRCEYNDALRDSPIAVFIEGKVTWFSIKSNFSKYVVCKIDERLNLSSDERILLQQLISQKEASYEDCMPEGWSWTCGEGGEITFSEKLQIRGKLAINISNFYEHAVRFDTTEEYGEVFSEATGEECGDDDTEFAAISA